MSTAITAESAEAAGVGLHRKIDWTGAFWVASGVPALVLFSIGGIAATVGKASWLVWTISIIFGFVQSFTYAEIAGLFPGKSGGASIYGAVAWVRYAKFIAPMSVWCNWFAWSPVLAIGSGLGAGYILSLFFAPDATINTWQITSARSRWGQGRADAPHQRDLLYRRCLDAGVLPDPAWRHSALGACDHDHGCRGPAAA